MRKEQILLVVSAALGALVVWSGTGKYTEVGASTLPEGRAVKVTTTVQPDPFRGLEPAGLKGRAVSAQVRLEKRPPLPEIPAPAALPLSWVRPVPTPGVAPERWRPFRQQIVPQKKDDTAAAETQPTVPGGAAPPSETPKADTVDLTKEAALVSRSGELQYGKMEPWGALKGQPDWSVLEKWPNGPFRWGQMGKKGNVIGWVVYENASMLESFSTIHLRKSLLNEFHEERIRSATRDNDRQSLVRFATWVHDNLPSHVGADGGSPYGVAAIRLAIGELEKARALQNDLPLTRQLAEYYRSAYDLQGAVGVVREYVEKTSAETATMVYAGEIFERAGLHARAKQWYDKAASTGDAEARLRVGLVLEKMGDFDAAFDALKAVSNMASQSARALTAMARIRLRQGQIDEAGTLAEQARKDGAPDLSLVLGAIQYARARYDDAEKSFAAAALESQRTEARSNRGMALALAGNLDGAATEYQFCLDNDPLNLVDPLFGLGDLAQRRGDGTRANDYFETALARAPDHPWILLRLGTLRLRDGQPDKALVLGRHLLEVSPGCTEGLWLVGRAAASAEKPDWDAAIGHLRRALAKEPDNRDFVHEAARTLLFAGRTEEATRDLEKAVEITRGVARSDARVLALCAYAFFVSKRPIESVYEMLGRAEKAQPDDTTKEYLVNVRRIINEWDRRRVWLDAFDRPASGTVGNNWRENDQAQDIRIQVNEKGHVVFSGRARQAAASRDQATRLERDDDLGRFISVQTSFRATSQVETIFHLFVGGIPDRPDPSGTQPKARGQGSELGVGCDRTGMMVVWQVSGKTGEKRETIVRDAAGNPRPWPMDDQFHTVRITRRDNQKGVFEIEVDDEKIAGDKGTTFEVGALGQSNKPFTLGFLVDAEAGTPVEVAVESVQVMKTK